MYEYVLYEGEYAECMCVNVSANTVQYLHHSRASHLSLGGSGTVGDVLAN